MDMTEPEVTADTYRYCALSRSHHSYSLAI